VLPPAPALDLLLVAAKLAKSHCLSLDFRLLSSSQHLKVKKQPEKNERMVFVLSSVQNSGDVEVTKMQT